MGKSILNDKWILVVDDNPDFLLGLQEQIRKIAPNCHCDKATDYKNAAELLASFTYDLVILDSLSVRCSNLHSRAVTRFPPSPVVLLTSRYLDPESLKGFVKMGARIYPAKENVREIYSLSGRRGQTQKFSRMEAPSSRFRRTLQKQN